MCHIFTFSLAHQLKTKYLKHIRHNRGIVTSQCICFTNGSKANSSTPLREDMRAFVQLQEENASCGCGLK